MPLLALREYGLAGNEFSSALVSRFGSVDWLALPFLDSRSHFSAYFSERTGGRFQIFPDGEYKSEFQPHGQDGQAAMTTILFETPHGKALLSTWMPPGQPCLHREAEVLEGSVVWQIHCSPRFEASGRPPQCEFFSNGILFRGARADHLAHLLSDHSLRISPEGHSAIARITLKAGEKARFAWNFGRESIREKMDLASFHSVSAPQHRCPPQGCPFSGPWHHLVMRSDTLLSLVQNRWTGLLAESVVPSQPEFHAGDPNHRSIQSWSRDLVFGMQALANLGRTEEAQRLFLRASDLLMRDTPEGFQPAYTLDGGHNSFHHMESDPLFRRLHFDVQGQFLIAAAEYFRLSNSLPPGLWPVLCDLTDSICRTWRRPDWGAWEVAEGRSDHFVTSKVIAWAGIDRACWLSSALANSNATGGNADQDPHARKRQLQNWKEEARILHRTICEQGYDPSQGTFVRSFSDRDLDAATLLIPILGFLPTEDPRVVGTIAMIQASLAESVFIHRYRERNRRPQEPELFFSFLYVAALAASGRTDEASDRLAELCSYATPSGYFGDRVDLRTGYTVGPFPSTEAHLGLIQAASYVALARGRSLSFPPLTARTQPAAPASREEAA